MKRRILEIRKRIDRLDDELLELLLGRLKLGQEIGRVKLELGLPATDVKREEEIIERVVNLAEGRIAREEIEKIFSAIMETTRRTQELQTDVTE